MKGKKNMTYGYIKVLVVLLGVLCFSAACYCILLLWSFPNAPFSIGFNCIHIPTADEFIQVLIVPKSDHFVGTLALVNSIIRNSRSPIHFYFLTDSKSAQNLSDKIENSLLKEISYVIKIFDVEKYSIINEKPETDLKPGDKLDFYKFYLSEILPNVDGILICLDDDMIIQGDLSELHNISLISNYVGALSKDCDVISKRFNQGKVNYYHYLNLQNPHLKDLDINGKACVFNLGVMVLNMTTWKSENITGQLKYWHMLSRMEKIFHISGVLSPFLIVLHNQIFPLDNSWNVRHLGMSRGSSYSRSFLEKANLLHWDGHFKPWKNKSPYADLWEKYRVRNP